MKYMVAVDGSAHATKALDLALSLAKGRESDEVVTLTVVDEYSASDLLDEEAIIVGGEAVNKANVELRTNAEAVVKKATEHCAKHGVAARGLLVVGNSRDAIVETAKKEKIDIIIVGSRGLGTLSRLLLGSVSDYVVKHSPCPVLVARWEDDSDSDKQA